MKKNIKSLIIGILLFNFLSCQYSHSQFLKGNEQITKVDRPVSSFQTVEVQDGIDLYITQGASEKLQVEADENLHEYIKTEIAQGVLKIYLSKSVWRSKCMKIYLTIVNINELSASGGSDIETVGTLKLGEISVICSGGSDAKLNIEAEKLKFKASGGSDGFISGTANSFLAKASGGSDIKAYDLKAVDCYIEVNGGSDAEITASGLLNVSASGGSDVAYKGTPNNIDSDMSGGSGLHHN